MTENSSPTRLIGYARVSSVGQTLDVQLDQLAAAGCRPIYREKVTGTRADRRELQKLLREIGPGDVVIVTRIDRLARSIFDLFGIVQRIADAGASFRSLGQAWADTSTAQGRMMLAVMGGMAEVEREMILTRTAEGRARAVARGGKMGRRPRLTHAQECEVRERLSAGEPVADLARSYAVGPATIYRIRDRGQAL